MLEFPDLGKMDTSGPLRIQRFWEGWCVIGLGLLIPCRDREDAERELALLLEDKGGGGIRITREMVDAGLVTEDEPGRFSAREADIGTVGRIRRWIGTDLGNGRTFDLVRMTEYKLEYRQDLGSITLIIYMTI